MKKRVVNKARKHLASTATDTAKSSRIPAYVPPVNSTLPTPEELEQMQKDYVKRQPTPQKPVDRRTLHAEGLAQYVQRNPTLQHKLNRTITSPDDMQEAIKQIHSPSIPAEVVESNASANPGQAPTDEATGLKRRRNPRFMGTDPSLNQALVEEMLLRRQIESALVDNPDLIKSIPENGVSAGHADYMRRLVMSSEKLQSRGAVLLTPETAREHGIAVNPAAIVPGAHLVLPGTDIAAQIDEMSKARQKAFDDQLSRRTRLPTGWLVASCALMLGSYTLALIWEVHIELYDEAPKWAQWFARNVMGVMPLPEDDEDEAEDEAY